MKKRFLPLFLLLILFGCKGKEEITEKPDASVKELTFNDNSIRYYEKIYHKAYGNCDDKTDCAEIKIEYPEIISNSPATDSVNSFIKKHILNLPFNEDEYHSFDEIADSLFSGYITVQQDFKDYHNGWYIHSSTEITGIFKDILTLKSEEIIYTGGANPYYDLTFANFDIKTGNKIELINIISENNFEELNNIGKDLFIKLKNIKPNTSFEKAGFWFENKKFSLNDNFAIADSGLVFFYNLYEIAPRSEGTTKLFIPKEKLKSITNIY